MKRRNRIQHKFVEFIPEQLDDNILYISIEYGTASHKCLCGCGNEVITPFSPTDWRLIYDANSVSLDPSIGNWSFPCKSHYWISKGFIEWSYSWDEKRIERGRRFDSASKRQFYDGETSIQKEHEENKESIFTRLWKQLMKEEQ